MNDELRVTGHRKSDQEHLTDALRDMHYAIAALRSEQQQRELGPLVRVCSIFLRKLVLGDRGARETRLLRDSVLKSIVMPLRPIRKIPKEERRIVRNGFSFSNGSVTFTKLDEPNRGKVAVLPLSDMDVDLQLHLPLPGIANWTGIPTKDNLWLMASDQLFDMKSRQNLTCDSWLAQQVVRFDGIGISLKDIIQYVANHEGAHALNREQRQQAQQKANPHREKTRHALDLLNCTFLFGMPFNHIIVFEAAMYLYQLLLKEPSIDNPTSNPYQEVNMGFCPPPDQAMSLQPDWFNFDISTIMPLGPGHWTARHIIKPVR